MTDDLRTQTFQLFRENVLSELQAQNAIHELDLPDGVLTGLAEAVAANAAYAFDIRWNPHWVGPGEPHVWAAADGAHARCNDCLAASPPSTSPAEASAWHKAHRAALHTNAVP